MNKKQLFAAGAPKREPVTVSGLDEPLLVRGLSAAQRGVMIQELYDDGKLKAGKCFAAELVARCVVDQDGARVFDDSDIEELGTLAQTFIDPLFDAANRLSGLGAEAKDEAEKN